MKLIEKTWGDGLISYRAEVRRPDFVEGRFIYAVSFGITPAHKVDYVYKLSSGAWRSRREDQMRKYFFKDDKPWAFCPRPHIVLDVWPTNLPAEFDGETFKDIINTLKVRVPDAADSIDACVEILSHPGKDYSGTYTGRISMDDL